MLRRILVSKPVSSVSQIVTSYSHTSKRNVIIKQTINSFVPCCRSLSFFVTLMDMNRSTGSPKKAEKVQVDASKMGQGSRKYSFGKDDGGTVTRSKSNQADADWREHFLKMALEEKRKLYACKTKYFTVDQIIAWPDYIAGIKYETRSKVKPKFDIDEGLNLKVTMWKGDITTLEIDAICNAANKTLLGGGGVDGAIHKAAGPKLKEECRKLGGCETGDAKLTGGYKLPAKYVIHTVGPIGENRERLRSCYKTCLNIAKKEKIRTIAFPCISTGIYGYDVEKATPVVMQTVREWLQEGDNSKHIDKIIFCVFLKNDVDVYEQNMLEYFPFEVPKEMPETKRPRTEEIEVATNGDVIYQKASDKPKHKKEIDLAEKERNKDKSEDLKNDNSKVSDKSMEEAVVNSSPVEDKVLTGDRLQSDIHVQDGESDKNKKRKKKINHDPKEGSEVEKVKDDDKGKKENDSVESKQESKKISPKKKS